MDFVINILFIFEQHFIYFITFSFLTSKRIKQKTTCLYINKNYITLADFINSR